MTKMSSNIKGVGFLVLSALIISLQNVIVKWIGGQFSALEIIAPFEYVSLLINIRWGFFIWREIPTWMILGGVALTLLSGLYVLVRERQEQQ
jgi:drug/metabolite transporter (DMT)-like permease